MTAAPNTLGYRYWFNTTQAADYSALSPQTIQRACRTGELKAGQPTHAGKGHWRIHRDDLDAWLRGGTNTTE